LFEPEPSPERAPTVVPSVVGADSLIDQLLASPTFAAQRQRNPRANAIGDERLARYLRVITDNGGTIPLATLADRTGEPTDQIRMALMMVRRLVNFDGTEVLAVSAANDVELNADLLTIQFDLNDH
jgi:hypothetical protein